MAAPESMTVRDLNGTWVMNKALSDSIDDALALQGIGWLTRKAIGLATVTLALRQYDDAAGVTHIDIAQTATGGLKGTAEARALDGAWLAHSDWLFGAVRGRTVWAAAVPADEPFLATRWEPRAAEWVYNFVESLGAGWTAAQLWGFQIVAGERRHARNVVIRKGSKKVEFRLVYDYVSDKK